MELIRIYSDLFPLAGVLVAYDEFGLADLLFDGKNSPQVAAALAALKAFKTQDKNPSFFLISGHHENIELRLKKGI